MTLIEEGPVRGAADRADFRDWVRPHWDAMVRVAARIARPSERDDVLQNALVLAWRRREQFDAARGSERSWLLAITANEARKSHRAPAHDELVDTGALVADGQPDIDLQRAVARLPERQRIAVELHYYVGLSIAETARVMSCAEGTVKSTLAAARGRLRTDLERASSC